MLLWTIGEEPGLPHRVLWHVRCKAREKPTLRLQTSRKVYRLHTWSSSLSPAFWVAGWLASRMLYPVTDEVARNGTLLRLTRPEDLLSVSLLLGNS